MRKFDFKKLGRLKLLNLNLFKIKLEFNRTGLTNFLPMN